MTFLTKLVGVLALTFSLAANALEYKEVQANLTEKYVVVATNQYCKVGSSETTVLYQAYIRDVTNGETVDEGCWYPQGEVIYIILPPVNGSEAVYFGVEALKFYKLTNM